MPFAHIIVPCTPSRAVTSGLPRIPLIESLSEVRDDKIGVQECIAKAFNQDSCTSCPEDILYAHALAIVVVEHGFALRSMSFSAAVEGRPVPQDILNWWFENMYVNVFRLQMNKSIWHNVKISLTKAESADVIGSVDAAVGDVLLRQVVVQVIEALNSAQILKKQLPCCGRFSPDTFNMERKVCPLREYLRQ